MQKILTPQIFTQSAKEVAGTLLESRIIRRINKSNITFEVKEVEIYEGFQDSASHAFKGKTKRNKVMFEKGGVFYIYLVYGIHFMLNVVVGEKDYPAAILIRGAGKYDGPGKLTKGLKVDFSFNGKEVAKKNSLWFEKYEKKSRIKKLPRVGVNYADSFWRKAPLRFVKSNF